MSDHEEKHDRNRVDESVATRVTEFKEVSPKTWMNAWLQVTGAHLMNVGSWGSLNAFGAYYNFYLKEYTPSVLAVSWIGITQATLVVLVGVLTGRIFDRGYLRQLLLVGCFLTIFGFMMLSLSTQYYQLLLSQGVCMGIGGGIIYVPSLAMVATQFENPKLRSLAMAFATSGAGVGGMIYPAALNNLLPLIGFPWASRVLAFVTLFCFVVALVILMPSMKKVMSQVPRNLFELSAFKEMPFVVFSISLFLVFLAYWAPLFQIPTFAVGKLGDSGTFAINMLFVANGLTIPGRVLGAVLASKFGAPNVLVGFLFASGIVLLGWLGVSTHGAFIAWTVVFGFVIGPITVLIPAVLPNLSPPHLIGTRMGLAWGMAAFGALLGVPLSGALNNIATGIFWKSIVLHSVAMLGGAVSMVLVAIAITQSRA